MNYIGTMLLLFTGFTLLYAVYVLLREHAERNKPAQGTQPVLPYLSAKSSDPVPQNVLKGNAFEKFVVMCFNRKYFHLKNWRSDKFHNGRFPSSNRDPDMLFEYRDMDNCIPFAVECKWRSAFRDNAIQWANNRQINNYFAYQEHQRINVFVVIGVGGTPENPEELYVLPLNRIPGHMTHLTASFLAPFEKRPGSAFFLNTRNLSLS